MQHFVNAWLLRRRSVFRHGRKVMSFLLLVAGTLAGCGETITLGAFESRSCWEVSRQIDGYKKTCGYVGVRRERGPGALVGDEVLGLAVVRYRPPDPELPPLVYLLDGPGEDALITANTVSFASEFFGILSGGRREIVLFDPRGVGRSLPELSCEWGIDDFGDSIKVDRWIRACRRDLRGYDSVENAGDVAAIAEALGFERIALVASSYGTRLAQHVLRDHPSLVSSVVLEGVMPMEGEVNLLGSWGVAVEEAAAAASTVCQEMVECRAVSPDLEGAIEDALERLPPEGLDLAGERLTPTEFVKQLRIAASQSGLEKLVRIVLATQNLINSSPDSLAAVDTEAEALLWDRIRNTSYTDNSFTGHPVWAAVSASDRVVRGEAAMTRWEATRQATDELIRGIDRARESWNVATLPEHAIQPIRSDVPALLLNGAIDPTTPASWAHLVGRSLTRSTVAVVPTAGHRVAAAGDPCGLELAEAFLAEPEAALDTTCTSERRFELGLLTGWDF